MNKLQAFEKELEHIHSPKIREFAEKSLETLPDYFYHIGASSTGKYHPSYALGEGGLVRHVRSAIRIAVELFRMEMFKFTEEEKDLLIVALMLHDGTKSGIVQQKFTVFEHPIIVADYINDNNDLHGIISEEQLETILNGVKRHMSQWNTSKQSEVVLPKPQSSFDKFVSLCDYLASRKCLEMNFEAPLTRD